MKKSTKCTALLTSLLLLSAGVNAIFVGTIGGRASKQAQQIERQDPARSEFLRSMHASAKALLAQK
jgi:hypothetical protein